MTPAAAARQDGTDFVSPSPSGSVTAPASHTRAEISIDLCDDDPTDGSETLLIEDPADRGPC